MRRNYFLLALLFVTLRITGQVSLTNGTPGVTIDFSSATPAGIGSNPSTAFSATGFGANTTTAGSLNSNAWAITGWSDGDLAFGGSRTTGDYARGAVSTAQSTSGMYAYTGAPGSVADPALMIQSGGSDWAPGTLTLRIRNDGNTNIVSIAASYNLYIRNDEERSNSFNFSYSTDNITYTPVAAIDYTSTAASDALGWVIVGSAPSRSTNITALNVAPAGFFYIRWSGADVGGSGSRDEFGLDDISITATFANDESTADYRSVTSGNYGTAATWEYNYTGALYQTPSAGPGSGNNVLIQNGHTVTLTADGEANILTLQPTGNIILGNNDLTVSSTSGGSATGYVKTNGTGEFIIYSLNGSKNFPVGNAKYNPLIIENGNNYNWGINVEDGVTGNAGLNTTKAVLVTWNITPVEIIIGQLVTTSTDITFQFDETTQTGAGFSIAENVQAWRKPSTTWLGAGTPASVLGTAGARTVKVLGLTQFTPYALANVSGPLPVNFYTVKASQQTSGIKVEWSNLTETDVANYAIERSADGRSFSSIGSQTARLNNGSKADYGFLDISPLNGINYYRIRSAEINGNNKYSMIVKVDTKGGKTDIIIYPNPVTGNQVSLQLTGLQKGQYNIKILSANGQQVYKKLLLHNGGAATEVLPLPASIKPGMYSLELSGGEVNMKKTFIVR